MCATQTYKMENIILFDDPSRKRLYPLTMTRPICELRVGILTIREKWELWFNNKVSHVTVPHLSEKYPLIVKDRNLVINGGILPTPSLCEEIIEMDEDDVLLKDNLMIAAKISKDRFGILQRDAELGGLRKIQSSASFIKIENCWDIFHYNGEAIQSDFEKITRNRLSEAISPTNQVINKSNIFIEAGAKVECSILNASTGPIYIGKNAEIMEGCIVRGPLALCEKGVLKLGAKIYGPTTVGPYSKIGGEVNNSVITGFSNKGHDGFLGNSVLGEWCNIGADSNNSNLKNNYAEVRLWNYETESFEKTGLQFCGLVMGDHSKCGINTMFNTGTVIGVSSNIFGAGFPRNFVPSFSWGGASGFSTYRLRKAFETAELVMKRRGKELDEVEKKILEHAFSESKTYRRWDT